MKGSLSVFVAFAADEPTGDTLGVIAADFAGVGVEDIHSVDLDTDWPKSTRANAKHSSHAWSNM